MFKKYQRKTTLHVRTGVGGQDGSSQKRNRAYRIVGLFNKLVIFDVATFWMLSHLSRYVYVSEDRICENAFRTEMNVPKILLAIST